MYKDKYMYKDKDNGNACPENFKWFASKNMTPKEYG